MKILIILLMLLTFGAAQFVFAGATVLSDAEMDKVVSGELNLSALIDRISESVVRFGDGIRGRVPAAAQRFGDGIRGRIPGIPEKVKNSLLITVNGK